MPATTTAPTFRVLLLCCDYLCPWVFCSSFFRLLFCSLAQGVSIPSIPNRWNNEQQILHVTHGTGRKITQESP